jgi:hypothetical protein
LNSHTLGNLVKDSDRGFNWLQWLTWLSTDVNG